MHIKQTQARLPLRLVVAFTSVSLAAFGLATPIQAATSVPTTSSGSTELIDSLVVKYEPGAADADKTGNPNGEAAVTENVDLSIGRDLGRGFRVINLDKAVTVSEAQKISDQLAGSTPVQVAQPNYSFTVNDVLGSTATVTQSISGNVNVANWGLDRIDQATSSLDGSYKYSSLGTGVNIYVVDTGVRGTHTEFQTGGVSRVQLGYSAISGDTSPANTDCAGHGTHVAGIAAGNTRGIAKAASIIPVRILNCSGSSTSAELVAGINWIISNHASGQPAVANFSLGSTTATGHITSVDSAMTDLIADGVVPVVASGNGNNAGVPQDACNYSPANSPGPISVNASTSSDTAASFSNYGTCTDIYAPGVNINSAGISNDTSYVLMSGTSMASPFVAGVAANILSESPTKTMSQVWATLQAEAVNVIPADTHSTPTILLHQPWDGWSSSTKAAAALQVLAEQQAAAAAAKAIADAEAARVAAEQAAAQAAAEAAAAELATRTLSVKSKTAIKTLATRVGISYTKKATVSLTVAKASKKICSVSGGKLKALKAGDCNVVIKVQEPKPKKGKRPAAVSTPKTFVLQ